MKVDDSAPHVMPIASERALDNYVTAFHRAEEAMEALKKANAACTEANKERHATWVVMTQFVREGRLDKDAVYRVKSRNYRDADGLIIGESNANGYPAPRKMFR